MPKRICSALIFLFLISDFDPHLFSLLFQRSLAMTACDLSACAKPWQIQYDTVQVIFEEFYAQGDEEKKNGRKPIPMMDRNTADRLPHQQVI